MQIIRDVKQQTPEWFAMRDLKLTASHAQAIGNCGKGLDTLCRDLVIYHNNPPSEEDKYTNENIANGVELEASARNFFEIATGLEVEQVCFILRGGVAGCSPDGLTSDNGLIEIKCPNDKTYFDYLVDRVVDSKYDWQMQMQMLICKRQFCYYVVYNPNFKDSIQITKVYADKEKQDALVKGIRKGRQLLKEYLNVLKGK